MTKADSSHPQRPPGLRLLASLIGHESEIRRVAWSPDGRLLASPSSDRTVRIWDTQTGRALHVLSGHAGTVYCVAWSLDGHFLASGSADATIRLWDARSGQLLDILQGHTYWVNALAWFPNGVLASASEDKAILLWDLKSRRPTRELLGHTNAINSLAWSPDRHRLASGSGDKSARIWTLSPGNLGTLLLDHPDWVISLAWSPDGDTIATACWDGVIRQWDAKTGVEIAAVIGHNSRLTSLAFSFDGRFLASKASDNSVRLWRCDTWQQVAQIPELSSGRQSPSVSFHPHEPLLVTLGRKETSIRLWLLEPQTLLLPPSGPVERTPVGDGAVHHQMGPAAVHISSWGSDDFEVLVNRVENASTSDEKGRSLEELCRRLFETIEGFTVTERVHTATEEIDLLVLNNSTEPRLRRELPLILVECKNWSAKCGKNEFVVFHAKLENRKRRSSLGFLVSWNGFAETFTSEMLRGSREETLVVPISGEEIIAAVRDDNFSTRLNEWWDRAVAL